MLLKGVFAAVNVVAMTRTATRSAESRISTRTNNQNKNQIINTIINPMESAPANGDDVEVNLKNKPMPTITVNGVKLTNLQINVLERYPKKRVSRSRLFTL
jgi:hypothetical protein